MEAVGSIALEMLTAVQDSTVTMENVLKDVAKIPIVPAVTHASTTIASILSAVPILLMRTV